MIAPARHLEIVRRAQMDAILMSRHGQPVFCPYPIVAEAVAWKREFDLTLAAEKAKK